ncbi:phosphopentothenoylcysteine decarboxylase, putative [Ricinus communis]|uniref:phosphopantothenoylcysteine decarboxylase n=2 Tax=Ricinus communis TaxID=3988 RepID=B9RAN6_RICCO|nr:phosphopentothenoylcysteine decarboxylase, putative [Ricinus communis]
MEPIQLDNATRKPKILLAACGCVAALRFGDICKYFCGWAEVRAVATRDSLRFINRESLPKDVVLYTDEDECSSWNEIGDRVLHIELRRWADVMLIAPLSANTLAKIAGGLGDNLLTCIVRAWDNSKPVFVAPAMNTCMWKNPFTERHLHGVDELGINLIRPVSKRLACGDYGDGAMAETSSIYSTIRHFLESRAQPGERIEMELIQKSTAPNKPRILIAASGCVAAMKFGFICQSFCGWAEVRAVATRASLRFIDKTLLPTDVFLYTDEDDWSSWNEIGDRVLHMELRHWADIMLIAPLSANTLAKIVGGFCDNLLTCIVRAWDNSKPFFVAPAMNTFMWNNPFTERHLKSIKELGISLIQPVTNANGAIAEPTLIYLFIRQSLESRARAQPGEG